MSTIDTLQNEIDAAYDCDCPELVEKLEAEAEALQPALKPLTESELLACDLIEDPYAMTANMLVGEE